LHSVDIVTNDYYYRLQLWIHANDTTHILHLCMKTTTLLYWV